MKCDICGGESESGHLIQGEGFCCSVDCAQIARERRRVHHEKLKAEALDIMPEALTTYDFEVWALKLSIHFLAKLTKRQRARIEHGNPMMLAPEILALDLKDKILRHVPKAYVSEAEHRGHERIFSAGSYMFRQPVPKETIVEATRKAGIFKS